MYAERNDLINISLVITPQIVYEAVVSHHLAICHSPQYFFRIRQVLYHS